MYCIYLLIDIYTLNVNISFVVTWYISLVFFLVLLENAHTIVRNSQGDVNSKGY